MSRKKSIRCRNMMYTQQLRHLPFEIDDLETIIAALSPEKYAYIIHDNDTDDEKLVEKHLHLMLTFKNARSLNSVAKAFKDKPEYIELFTKNEENGYAYLVHRTDKSRHKYQYNLNEVTANFDYPDFIAQIEKEIVKANSHNQTKLLLDAFKAGHITKQELEQRLTGSEYGKLKHQIENIHSVILRLKADEWRKEAITKGKTLTVIWLYGESGTGKTSLAKHLVNKTGLTLFITGSSNDLFQSYNGEHAVIIDDLRNHTIRYEDLLRITDPHSIEYGINAPSRYYDKALAVELIVITSPYNPYEFYLGEVPKSHRKIDTFAQLNRRITLSMFLDMDYLYHVSFDGIKYVADNNTKQINTLSEKARPQRQGERSEDIFKKLFD